MKIRLVVTVAAASLGLAACAGSGGESAPSEVPGLSNVTDYFENPNNASGIGSLKDICDVWNLAVSGDEPGYDDAARDTLRALITLEDPDWSGLSPEAQDEAMTVFLTDNCAETPQPGNEEMQAPEAETQESAESPTPAPSVDPEPEEPPYVGNDAAYDYLMAVRDNQPDGWNLNRDDLPTRQEVTGRVLPEMVNPERCADLASIVDAGFLVQEGPIQYIQDAEEGDGVDNFVVIGQAPLDSLRDISEVASECKTFAISRRSSSVIDNSPTSDVVTYELTTEIQDSGYILLTFTGEGEIQIVDTNYDCLREGEGFCMYPRSENGYRLLRQEGENFIVAAVTNYRDKGGSAPRPMRKADFQDQAQAILESFVIREPS